MNETISGGLNGWKNGHSFNVKERKSEIIQGLTIPSNYKEGIDLVFEQNPELTDIIINSLKSDEKIRLYRIENKNIPYDYSREWIVSKKEIVWCFFTDNVDTLSCYIKKNQLNPGIKLVYVDIAKNQLNEFHVSNNNYAQDMDVEKDNWIIPKQVDRQYVDLSSLPKVTGNIVSLNTAKQELGKIIDNLPIKSWITEITEQQAKQLYAEYLTTIFPESKVQDIVWHGTRGDWYKTQDFDLNLAGTWSGNKENTKDSIYFIKYIKGATTFGDQKTAFWALINIKKPNILPLGEFNKTWNSKEEYTLIKKGDGIIAEQEESPE